MISTTFTYRDVVVCSLKVKYYLHFISSWTKKMKSSDITF